MDVGVATASSFSRTARTTGNGSLLQLSAKWKAVNTSEKPGAS